MNRLALSAIRLSSRAAARLAVVLLLVTCTLQVVEISHQHSAPDTAEHCLLCKADGHAAINAEAPAAASGYAAAPATDPGAAAPPRQLHILPPARGPPART